MCGDGGGKVGKTWRLACWMLRRGTRRKKVPISGGEDRSHFTNDSMGSQDIHFLQGVNIKLLMFLIPSRYGNYESWLLGWLYNLSCQWIIWERKVVLLIITHPWNCLAVLGKLGHTFPDNVIQKEPGHNLGYSVAVKRFLLCFLLQGKNERLWCEG